MLEINFGCQFHFGKSSLFGVVLVTFVRFPAGLVFRLCTNSCRLDKSWGSRKSQQMCRITEQVSCNPILYGCNLAHNRALLGDAALRENDRMLEIGITIF